MGLVLLPVALRENGLRKRLPIGGAALMLGALGVWLIVAWARGTLAQPVWFVLWYANLVLRGFHQALYWALFLVVAAAVAVASLVLGLRPARSAAEPAPPGPAPLRQLARSIDRAASGRYFKWSLARTLSALVIRALDGGEGQDAAQKRELLERRGGDLPPELRAYVEAAEWGSYAGLADTSPRKLCSRLSARSASPLDLAPETVVDYLERQLEVPREPGTA